MAQGDTHDTSGRWPTVHGVRLESPEAVLTALAHRLEDQYRHGADGAANPTGLHETAASSTIAARLDGRVSGPKVVRPETWHRAWRGTCGGTEAGGAAVPVVGQRGSACVKSCFGMTPMA